MRKQYFLAMMMQTNNFWHRRVAQVAIALSAGIALLYLVTNFTDTTNDLTLYVGAVPAALAAITLITALASLFLPPKGLAETLPLLTQNFLVITAATLIYTTGAAYSPYIILWVPAVMLVGVFGIKALAWTALVPLLYSAWLSFGETLTLQTGVILTLTGLVPLALSYVLFSHLSIEKEESTYNQLANQFSQMSDKAEVVITAISNGVVALDKQGVIELINPAAQKIIGWDRKDALKLDYKSVLKLTDLESNDLTQANDPIFRALSTNEEVRSEDFILVTKSGKKLDVSIVASPVGQPGSGVIVVFRDITKEKAEEREQTEFISTASHEMRTPVASIEGYLGLALNPATAQIDDKARGYITKAQEVAQHLGRLFQDLLDITKAEDGRLSNNPRAVEVVTFVQDIIGGLRPQAEAKGLILLYKPVPDDTEDDKSNRRLNPVFYANVDNDHLREIVSNLVENAIKYTNQGTISVDVGGDDKHVEISVEDTGIGIPAEDLPHLFQKFYRVDNTDTREIGGTGLGLYLSRRLAEAMEGRIWAESQHGEGSTFFLSIPRISHQEAMQLIEALDNEDQQPEIGPAVIAPELEDPSPIPATPPVPSMEPTPPASANSSDGVFVSPPAEVVAAQLTSTPQPSQPQPVVQPQQLQPQTPPQTPQPQPTQQPQAPAAPRSAPTMAEIEQDPRLYIARQNTVNIPPREPNTEPGNQHQA